MGAGADASGGRTAELLKVAASGRGVMTSRPPGRGAARRRGECWSVAALVAEENVNALAILMRGGGGRADTSTTGETAEAC